MTPEHQDRYIRECVHDSLVIDIEALKPGNVSRYASGHNMEAGHFIESARLTTPLLCDRRQNVGRRILSSIETTMNGVGCNTNLGIVLLCAPLVFAVQHKISDESLRDSLARTIDAIDRQQTVDIFRAICLAGPAGLGQSSQYDVHLQPEVTIKEAMRFSRDRDRIAYQYISQFEDIFEHGLEVIKASLTRWSRMEWAATSCFLEFLGTRHDSHVRRKFGDEVAEQLRKKAQPLMRQFRACADPETMVDELLVFDRELKDAGINPGTSADLTVASVLAYRLMNDIGYEEF